MAERVTLASSTSRDKPLLGVLGVIVCTCLAAGQNWHPSREKVCLKKVLIENGVCIHDTFPSKLSQLAQGRCFVRDCMMDGFLLSQRSQEM